MSIPDDVHDFIGLINTTLKRDREHINNIPEQKRDKQYYSEFFYPMMGIEGTIFEETKKRMDNARSLAIQVHDAVYQILLNGKPMYKHFENCLSYEMSEEAKKIRWIACDVYDYVVYLQMIDLFPVSTRKYLCDRLEKILHS